MSTRNVFYIFWKEWASVENGVGRLKLAFLLFASQSWLMAPRLVFLVALEV